MDAATRQSARRSHPTYRLRGEVLKALGPSAPYQRRTVDEIDRKVIAHVHEYGKVTNRTVQNLLDVGINRARDILADMVQRSSAIPPPRSSELTGGADGRCPFTSACDGVDPDCPA